MTEKFLLIETLPYSRICYTECEDCKEECDSFLMFRSESGFTHNAGMIVDEYHNVTPCDENEAMLFALRGEEVRRDPYDN